MMILGQGRVLKQRTKKEIAILSIPGLGEKLHSLLWKPKTLDDSKASNKFMCLTALPGAGKTNWTQVRAIDYFFKEGIGFLEVDAGGDLIDYTIARAAELGYPVEKFAVVDFLSPYGYPVIDFFEDDPEDAISPYKITEEFVSATALISTDRSSAGARQLDLTRMSALPNILRGRTLADLGLFLTDPGHRQTLVQKTGHPDLIRFWCGAHPYYAQLPKDSLESLRNKWNPLFLHPAIKRVISRKHSTIDLFWMMQHGGVVLVDLREGKLPLEIRRTIAQLIQYWFRLAVLKRQATKYRPLFYGVFDEFLQYKTWGTIDLIRIARQLGVGALFLLQDLGLLSPEEKRIMSLCSIVMAMGCGKEDAEDMAGELFVYSGQAAYRDWEETRYLTVQEEYNARVGALQKIAPGYVIARVKPSEDTWLLTVPDARKTAPKVSEKTVENYLRDVAKKHYVVS